MRLSLFGNKKSQIWLARLPHLTTFDGKWRLTGLKWFCLLGEMCEKWALPTRERSAEERETGSSWTNRLNSANNRLLQNQNYRTKVMSHTMKVCFSRWIDFYLKNKSNIAIISTPVEWKNRNISFIIWNYIYLIAITTSSSLKILKNSDEYIPLLKKKKLLNNNYKYFASTMLPHILSKICFKSEGRSKN